MARRGFFAELNYQAQQAEKRKRQQEAAAVRAYNAAIHESERAHKAAERARIAAERASAAERKAAEKEAKRLHVEAQEAEVAEKNSQLAATYDDIDSLLEWTLGVDDFVDLESLKVTPEHPPFKPGALAYPTPAVPTPVPPPTPQYFEPPPPRGLSAAFGGKKRHAAALEAARKSYEQQMGIHAETVEQERAQHAVALTKREQDETFRLEKLAQATSQYEVECQEREAEAKLRNDKLTLLINNLAFDVPAAIEEYVDIVLSNSVYPDAFPVDHEHTFDLATRELTLNVAVPEPSSLPSVKQYRYVKARDEIAGTQLSAKAQKDRYASAVHQTAIRTLHEVFEADRAAKINSIALTVGTSHLDPATGRPESVVLVQVAADRTSFEEFDLAQVVPVATLQHLGAAISKNPFELAPAGAGRGVARQDR